MAMGPFWRVWPREVFGNADGEREGGAFAWWVSWEGKCGAVKGGTGRKGGGERGCEGSAGGRCGFAVGWEDGTVTVRGGECSCGVLEVEERDDEDEKDDGGRVWPGDG